MVKKVHVFLHGVLIPQKIKTLFFALFLPQKEWKTMCRLLDRFPDFILFSIRLSTSKIRIPSIALKINFILFYLYFILRKHRCTRGTNKIK